MPEEPRLRILRVLERLNRARAKGNVALAAELDDELEQLDARRLFSRTGGLERDRRVAPVKIHRPGEKAQ